LTLLSKPLLSKQVGLFKGHELRLALVAGFFTLCPLGSLVTLFFHAGHFFLAFLKCCVRSAGHRAHSLILFSRAFFKSARQTNLRRGRRFELLGGRPGLKYSRCRQN